MVRGLYFSDRSDHLFSSKLKIGPHRFNQFTVFGSNSKRSISWEMHLVGFRGTQREKGQGHNSQVIRYLTSFRSRWSH